MWLVVGLGNPGSKYARNRHNIGFMVADELARRHGLPDWQDKHGGQLSSGRIGNDRVVLLKPMEFMNLSGFALVRAAQFYKVEPSEIIVVHDEIDLPFARIRLKSGGGHGGHNGLRSIVEQLGSTAFLRIRLGVGKPEKSDGSPGDGRVSSHVLSDFAADQQGEVDALVATASDAVEAIMETGIREAMNKFNGLGKKATPDDGGDESEKSAEKSAKKSGTQPDPGPGRKGPRAPDGSERQ